MLSKKETMEGIAFLQDIFPEITAEEKGPNQVEIGLKAVGFDEYKKRVAIAQVRALCPCQCIFNSQGFLEGVEQSQKDTAVCTGIEDPTKPATLTVRSEISLPVVISTAPCGKGLQRALEQRTLFNLPRN